MADYYSVIANAVSRSSSKTDQARRRERVAREQVAPLD